MNQFKNRHRKREIPFLMTLAKIGKNLSYKKILFIYILPGSIRLFLPTPPN